MDIISTIQVALYDFIFARKNIQFPLVTIASVGVTSPHKSNAE